MQPEEPAKLRPQKPLTPFFAYRQERLQQLTKQYPNYSQVLISKVLSKKWQSEDETVRNGYSQKYYLEMQRFQREVAKWNEDNKDDVIVISNRKKQKKFESLPIIHYQCDPSVRPQRLTRSNSKQMGQLIPHLLSRPSTGKIKADQIKQLPKESQTQAQEQEKNRSQQKVRQRVTRSQKKPKVKSGEKVSPAPMQKGLSPKMREKSGRANKSQRRR